MRAVIGLLVVAACSKSSSDPGNGATPKGPRATVDPPPGLFTRTPFRGPVLVDDGNALYLVPSVGDRLPVDVPAAATPVAITELGTALDRAAIPKAPDLARADAEMVTVPGVGVVLSASASAARAGGLADALWAAGRCLVPVLSDAKEPVTVGDHCVGFGLSPDERVELTVYVAKDNIWVGISRILEFQPIPPIAGTPDLDKLEAALKEHKRSAFFADRDDLQIAGGPGITYGELTAVAEVAAKVGFTALRFVSRDKAAALPER